MIADDAPNLANLTDAYTLVINFGPGEQTIVPVDFAGTAPGDITELLSVLNEAIRSTTLSGQVVFSAAAGKLQLGPATILTTNEITLSGKFR